MSTSNSERIVFFGDSLADNGNTYRITEQVLTVPFPLESAGYNRVFSNDRVYSQILPVLLGIPVVENYAFGAAEAIGSKPLSEFGAGALAPLVVPDPDPSLLALDINLGAQVDRFLAEEATDPFPGETTASILIGLNDFLGVATGGGDPFVDAAEVLGGVVSATFSAATTLATAGGVDKVVLYTFPEASFFPFSQGLDPGLVALGDRFVDLHETAIRLGAASLEVAGIETEVVDLNAITGEIAADPQSFGFLGTGPVVLGTGGNPMLLPDGTPFFPTNPAVAGLDEDQIIFWDFFHPTSALHGIFAAFSAAVIEDSTFFLGDGDNFSLGSPGDDFVLSGAGDDTLFLLGGEDTALAGLGNDRAWGQDGSDILAGGSGDGQLYGGEGADVLAGNAGHDLLMGGEGADALIDGLGSDWVYGGDGDDAFFHAEASLIGGVTGLDADFFFGGNGADTLFLAVSEANRAAAEAEIAGGAGPLGTFQFAELGLSLWGFEAVLLLDRSEFGGAPVAPELQAAVAEADLWGLV